MKGNFAKREKKYSYRNRVLFLGKLMCGIIRAQRYTIGNAAIYRCFQARLDRIEKILDLCNSLSLSLCLTFSAMLDNINFPFFLRVVGLYILLMPPPPFPPPSLFCPSGLTLTGAGGIFVFPLFFFWPWRLSKYPMELKNRKKGHPGEFSFPTFGPSANLLEK